MKEVFVTVGTTKFELLIEAISRADVAEALAERGYTRATVQYGKGEGEPYLKAPLNGICYRFKPDIASDMARADLIISHAGAGSIVEALRMGKRLLVVVNPLLMDNHQAELASTMERRGYLLAATCEGLAEAIRGADFDGLVPYPEADDALIPAAIDGLVYGE